MHRLRKNLSWIKLGSDRASVSRPRGVRHIKKYRDPLRVRSTGIKRGGKEELNGGARRFFERRQREKRNAVHRDITFTARIRARIFRN